ncbi:ferric enterobactin transport ATP-binding protein FepC [Salmonella enterica subsp. enterica]|nr:ferric enterobactin transport ATP-binding protein FepC [Salmonella enterica subsp. enterica] [Salmonella enterica subsp. enterica serovar Menston]
MTESVARLRGDQLTLGYGSYTVAKNLNVSIPDGHFTAIIGLTAAASQRCYAR